jgi:hypothetical protein
MGIGSNRRKTRVGFAILALSAGAYATCAQAYRIVFPHIHEEMTRGAEDCLAAAKHREPNNCLAYYEGFPARTVSVPKLLVAVENNPPLSSYQLASRWSDDPTGQIRPATIVKYLLDMEMKCKDIIADSRRLDEAGLLCSTHYGDLQFMHAQASRGEGAELTRHRILDWAAFAFDVAAGNVRGSANYCPTLQERPSSAVPGQPSFVSAAMAPADFAYCKDGRGLRQFREWRVSTFFTFRCRNPFTSRTCWETTDETLAQEQAQLRATGALLHLIQDSFSQSHVRRGPRGRIGAPDTHVSKIVCLPATEFYDYELQVKAAENHPGGDLPPSLDAASCQPGSAIHDPITASAMTLWYVKRGGDSARFVQYLREHVFG